MFWIVLYTRNRTFLPAIKNIWNTWRLDLDIETLAEISIYDSFATLANFILVVNRGYKWKLNFMPNMFLMTNLFLCESSSSGLLFLFLSGLITYLGIGFGVHFYCRAFRFAEHNSHMLVRDRIKILVSRLSIYLWYYIRGQMYTNFSQG